MFYKNDDWLPKTNNLYLIPLDNRESLLYHSDNTPERVLDTLRIEWVGCNFSIDESLLMHHIEEQEFIAVHDTHIDKNHIDIMFEHLNEQNISEKRDFIPFLNLMIKIVCHKNLGRNIVNTIMPQILKLH